MNILITILVGLVIIAVVLYLINAYIGDIRLRQILSLIIIVITIIWLLNFFFKFW